MVGGAILGGLIAVSLPQQVLRVAFATLLFSVAALTNVRVRPAAALAESEQPPADRLRLAGHYYDPGNDTVVHYVPRKLGLGVPAGAERSYRQQAIGIDAEYSRDKWIVRAEAIRSEWRLPAIAPALVARTGFVEGRVRVHPRVFVAARIDRMDFSRLTIHPTAQTWDAPVSRVELGGGWYFKRNLVAKAEWQYNWRDGGRVRRRGFVSGQLLFWF